MLQNVTVTNVYALSSVSTKTGNDGNLAGVIKTNDAKGELGYFNTGLDFYNYWVVKTDTVPLLKSFTTSDGQMDVTSWYEGVEGTETNPYVIDTAIELYGFAKRALDFNTEWVLMKDSIPMLRSFVDANDEDIIATDAWITESEGTEAEGVCNNVVLGTGAANGSITEQPTTKTKQELQTGYATLLNTEYWTVDTSKYDIPVLKDIIQ